MIRNINPIIEIHTNRLTDSSLNMVTASAFQILEKQTRKTN